MGLRGRDPVIGRSCCADVILVLILFGILVATTSCGDFQDPASSGSPVQSGGADLANLAAASLLNTFENAPSGATRPVTLSWDPSSGDVLGYKVYLVSISTSAEQIVDVGLATELTVPLEIDQTYGFTVTAYNASIESQALPYFLFHVFQDVIG
jgi:hypothetical protein